MSILILKVLYIFFISKLCSRPMRNTHIFLADKNKVASYKNTFVTHYNSHVPIHKRNNHSFEWKNFLGKTF